MGLGSARQEDGRVARATLARRYRDSDPRPAGVEERRGVGVRVPGIDDPERATARGSDQSTGIRVGRSGFAQLREEVSLRARDGDRVLLCLVVGMLLRDSVGSRIAAEKLAARSRSGKELDDAVGPHGAFPRGDVAAT